jgi:hypothetical protein
MSETTVYTTIAELRAEIAEEHEHCDKYRYAAVTAQDENERLRKINEEQARLINIQQALINEMASNPLGGWRETRS